LYSSQFGGTPLALSPKPVDSGKMKTRCVIPKAKTSRTRQVLAFGMASFSDHPESWPHAQPMRQLPPQIFALVDMKVNHEFV
jgi:hypothetical protein